MCVIGDEMIEQIKAVQLAQRVKAWDLAVFFNGIQFLAFRTKINVHITSQQDKNLSGFHYVYSVSKMCILLCLKHEVPIMEYFKHILK
jgi:hypothetical protein